MEAKVISGQKELVRFLTDFQQAVLFSRIYPPSPDWDPTFQETLSPSVQDNLNSLKEATNPKDIENLIMLLLTELNSGHELGAGPF